MGPMRVSMMRLGSLVGRQRFELHESSNGTRMVHTEHFNGVLVRLMRKSLDTQTLQGFEEMNVALKTRAEARGHNES